VTSRCVHTEAHFALISVQPVPVWKFILFKPQECNRLRLQLLLTKLRPGPLLVEDIPTNVSISSVSHSRISSLYHALRNVYTPLLGEDDGSEHSEADNQLQGLVMQLEAGLGSSLRQGQQVMHPHCEWHVLHTSSVHMRCRHEQTSPLPLALLFWIHSYC